MRIPVRLYQNFAIRLVHNALMREPDFTIGPENDPYLQRWWLIPRNRFFNIYLHRILRSDDDRAMHNHPWVNLSIILMGAYAEMTPKGERFRGTGSIVLRGARSLHRLIVPDILVNCRIPIWTLFITGPRIREWGFQCPQGFVPWREFVKPGASGEVGKGCGE